MGKKEEDADAGAALLGDVTSIVQVDDAAAEEAELDEGGTGSVECDRGDGDGELLPSLSFSFSSDADGLTHWRSNNTMVMTVMWIGE